MTKVPETQTEQSAALDFHVKIFNIQNNFNDTLSRLVILQLQ